MISEPGIAPFQTACQWAVWFRRIMNILLCPIQQRVLELGLALWESPEILGWPVWQGCRMWDDIIWCYFFLVFARLHMMGDLWYVWPPTSLVILSFPWFFGMITDKQSQQYNWPELWKHFMQRYDQLELQQGSRKVNSHTHHASRSMCSMANSKEGNSHIMSSNISSCLSHCHLETPETHKVQDPVSRPVAAWELASLMTRL